MSKKKFAIGRFPDGMHGGFLYGPFDKIKQATYEMGDEGEYIFVLQIDRPPKVIMWWDDETLTWERFE